MSPEASAIAGDQSMEELRRELAEAREQQAATAEILTSISSSATDAKQVFAKIAASSARLSDAHDASIVQVDGDNLRIVAHDGPIPPDDTLPLTREVATGRAVLGERFRSPMYRPNLVSTQWAAKMPDAFATAPYWPSH